jgi:hypothetical protein
MNFMQKMASAIIEHLATLKSIVGIICVIYYVTPATALEFDDMYLTDLIIEHKFDLSDPLTIEKMRFQCYLVFIAAQTASQNIPADTAPTEFSIRIKGKADEFEAAALEFLNIAMDQATISGQNPETLAAQYFDKWGGRYTLGMTTLLFDKETRGKAAGLAEFSENDFNICSGIFAAKEQATTEHTASPNP